MAGATVCVYVCVYVCVCMCVSEQDTDKKNAFSLRACEHTFVRMCCSIFLREKHLISNRSLGASWLAVASFNLSLWSQDIPLHPPARSAVGHSSRGEIRSLRGLQHLNLSGRSSRGVGWCRERETKRQGGHYRLLSNALLWGQNRRCYL